MISIIVTHKKDIFYLRDCLESIKDQKLDYLETILVVDHSEDDLTELVDEFKDAINLKVFQLTDKIGVGAARNLGIEKASGTYLYFLDNDDYLLSDAISKLVEVMDSQEECDMVYGRIKNTWFQKHAFNNEQPDSDPRYNEFLERYDFGDYFHIRYSAYRKLEKFTVLGCLYKKSLFVDNNIRFEEDCLFYADATVATALLKCVQTVKCNEKSVYIKRHHNDKISNPALSQYTKEETMPDYFVQYKRALEIAGDNNDLRQHLYLVLGKFIVKEYIRKIRYCKDDRWLGEYFEGLVEVAKNICFDRTTKKEFSRRERNMIKAVKGGNFEEVNKKALKVLVKRKLFSIIKNKKKLYKTITLHVFKKFKTRENYVVFESFMGRNCSGQPKYIYKYMQENYGNRFKYIWVVDKRGITIEGKHKKCKRFSLRYYYYMNVSKYWVNNMRQPLSVPRRPETIMLSTWHGTPLKKLVFDMDDIHSANPKYKENVYKQTRQWDYLLSDNPFSTDRFESCFLFDREKILEYGYPANDPMYAPDRDKIAANVKKKLGIPEDKKVILYAPTWRDDNFYDAGKYSFDLDLDIDRLQAEFGDEYVLLLRLHYFIVDKLDIKKYGKFTVNGSEYDDITDLYLISDILITDYSSVFFDYANLRRPILYYTYDLEKYRDVLRGFYLDVEKELPGPLLLTNDDVVNAIKNIDKVNEQYKDKYDEFYERFCCIDDGNAAKRVVEKVFNV